MEQVIIQPVKGTPVNTKTRFDHFKPRARSQTPFRDPPSDTSREESNTESEQESRATHSVDDGSEGDSSYFHEESDSADRMAPTGKTFQTQATCHTPPTAIVTVHYYTYAAKVDFIIQFKVYFP